MVIVYSFLRRSWISPLPGLLRVISTKMNVLIIMFMRNFDRSEIKLKILLYLRTNTHRATNALLHFRALWLECRAANVEGYTEGPHNVYL